MKLIKLNDITMGDDSREVFINPARITVLGAFRPINGTKIYFDGQDNDFIIVTESVDQVLAALEEV